jgi:acetyl esterase/lipase
MRSVYSSGTYQTGESWVRLLSRLDGDSDIAGRVAVFHCHGRGWDTSEALQPHWGVGLRTLVDAGYPVFSSDLGGTTTFGNATSVTRLEQLIAHARATYGVHATKVILSGTSMGAMTAMVWARANLTQVKAACLFIPAVSAQAIYSRNSFIASEIDAAYGGAAAWATARPNRDPLAFASELTSIPIKLWYSTNDPTILTSDVTDFAALSGAEVESMGAGGHSLTGLNVQSVLSFVRSP